MSQLSSRTPRQGKDEWVHGPQKWGCNFPAGSGLGGAGELGRHPPGCSSPWRQPRSLSCSRGGVRGLRGWGWPECALEAGGAALRCFLKNMTDCYSDDKSTKYSADILEMQSIRKNVKITCSLTILRYMQLHNPLFKTLVSGRVLKFRKLHIWGGIYIIWSVYCHIPSGDNILVFLQ